MEEAKLEALEIYKTCKNYSHEQVGENRVNDAKFRGKQIADKMIIEYDKIKDDRIPVEFIIEKMEHWENVKKEIDIL